MGILPCFWDWKGLPAPKWCFPPLSALKPEAKVTLVGWFLIFLACFLSFAFDISGKEAIHLTDREKTLILKTMNCQTRLFTSALGRQRQEAQELSLATKHETSLPETLIQNTTKGFNFKEGQQDGSAGKGTCWWTWWPPFNPRDLHNAKRESTP